MGKHFESRLDVAGKIDWEGGIFEALEYGIKASDMPESDQELTDAWQALEIAYRVAEACASRVYGLLPGESE